MAFDYNKQPGLLLKNKYEDIVSSPLISVITPYFNSGKFFEQTFNCVGNQTFPYFEWIIINDSRTCAEDKKLLDEFAAIDKRIKVLHTGELSISQARNYAIAKSVSDIIVPLDSDDLIEPNYFECLYWTLIRNPEASWVYTDSITFHDEEYLWRHEFCSETIKQENTCIYSAAIRKDAISEVGGYTELDKHFYEDWHFWLKLLEKGKRPAHLSAYLFWYRWSGTGALARIQNNEELRREGIRVIQQQAHKVPDGIRAITFHNKRVNEFQKPQKWEWDRKLSYKKKKTRILLLLPHMEMGGADKFNLDIVTQLDKERFDIGIITTVPAQSEWRQFFAEQVQDIFELPTFLDMNDWSSFIHYYIASRSVDIVMNISSYYGYYLIPWLRLEFPTVAIIDCMHAEGKYWRAGGYPRVSAAVDCILEKTFVTNEYTKNIMAERYGKDDEKMQVIYTGIDEQYFDPDIVDCDSVRQRFGITEDRPIALFLCRIAPEKRPFLMLEVAREIKKRIKNICFLVVGDGPQLEELKDKAEAYHLNDTVVFTGKQADIRPFYKICDLFLLTSIKEGLSITTMEAMAMGKPVISADVGSQYELVPADSGRLIKCLQDEAEDFDKRAFPQEEVNAYVNSIIDLLSNRENMGDIGRTNRKKILSGFTLNVLINTLEMCFSELISAAYGAARQQLYSSFRQYQTIAQDYLTLYVTYENMDVLASEVWKAREWYRNLYEQECNKNQNVVNNKIIVREPTVAGSEAELRLQEIYNMRSWKLIQKYRNFMDNKAIGRLLRKIRDFFR